MSIPPEMAGKTMTTLQKIPLSEIAFEPASLIDDVGRVFWYNGHIYRAIRSSYAEFYRELIKNKNIKSLFSKGLVATEMAPFSLNGYSLVLRHHRIPITSYCMEWSSEMLKDAAMLICDLNIEFHKKGLAFKDAHPWNILFDAGKAIFIDWGSIGSIGCSHGWPYVEFRDRFLFPLYLMSIGLSNIARTFMLNVANPLSRGDVFRLLIKRAPFLTCLHYWFNDKEYMRSIFKTDLSFFLSLRRKIEAISISGESTEWTGYQGPDERFSHQPSSKWHAKIRNIYELLRTMRPKTVTDIACNRGWFSELAALQDSQVVAIDIDEPSINTLYRRVREKGLSILPLVMDICTPTPPHGLTHAYSQAEIRLQSDMVLALALTHHLVFKKGLTFEAIAKQLAAFTKKWLVVEFIPADDQYVGEWMTERFAWYNLEGFTSALQVFFKRIEVIDSYPPPRLLLLCVK